MNLLSEEKRSRESGKAPTVESPTTSRSTLENGMRVITECIPSASSTAICVLVGGGMMDENTDQAGLAHLCEHLLFQGTSSRSGLEIARFMDQSGGYVGAFTARDYTCFSATVLPEYGTFALDLLGDILLNSIFPETAVERQKSAILAEMAIEADSPDAQAHALVKQTAWPDHPLGRPVDGDEESVASLTREDAIYFIHRVFMPNRMILAAAGPIEHEDFVAQARDAFWRLEGHVDWPEPGPAKHRGGLVIAHRELSQVYFSLALPAPSFVHPGRYAFHVLDRVLGGGISSRLFRHVREEAGLVYDIGTDYHAYRDGGMLVVEGSTAPEHLVEVLGKTLEIIGDLVCGNVPIDEDEFLRAKAQLRAQQLIGSSTYTSMSRLATQELYFGRSLGGEVLDGIEAVQLEDVQGIAEEFFDVANGSPTLAVVGPEGPEYGPEDLEDLLSTFHSACRGRKDPPPPESARRVEGEANGHR